MQEDSHRPYSKPVHNSLRTTGRNESEDVVHTQDSVTLQSPTPGDFPWALCRVRGLPLPEAARLRVGAAEQSLSTS